MALDQLDNRGSLLFTRFLSFEIKFIGQSWLDQMGFHDQYTIASLKVACFWKVGTLRPLAPSIVGFKTVSLRSPRRDKEGDRKDLGVVWNEWCVACVVACEDQLPSRDLIVPHERDEWTERLSASLTEPRCRPDSQAMRCFDVVLLAILPETLPARVTTILPREECDGLRPRLPHDWRKQEVKGRNFTAEIAYLETAAETWPCFKSRIMQQ